MVRRLAGVIRLGVAAVRGGRAHSSGEPQRKRMAMDENGSHREDFKAGLIGLTVALVGLFAVIAVSHFLAL